MLVQLLIPLWQIRFSCISELRIWLLKRDAVNLDIETNKKGIEGGNGA